MNMRNALRTWRVGAGTLAALLLLAVEAQAQVPGVVITQDDRRLQGMVRWKAVARKYTVTTSGAGGASYDLELDPSQVKRIEVAQPRELAPAVQAIRAGQVTPAVVQAMEKVLRDYTMLQWDEPAAQWLATAQLKNNDPAAAVKACEKVTVNRPEAAYLGDMAVVYWQALLKSGRSAKLNDFLTLAIKSGERGAAAMALIMRGDALMEQKQPREALKDGYLRVVVLFKNVRDVQPEALYKAAKAFDALKQVPNAEQMRTLLRTEYGSSDYAKML